MIRSYAIAEHPGRRWWMVLTLGICLTLPAGCSIAGSWKRIATEPAGAPFPVDHVTFARNHQYTASGPVYGQNRTSTGQYDWDGITLSILQAGRESRTYRGRVRLDGSLVLTYGAGKEKVTATLVRTDP